MKMEFFGPPGCGKTYIVENIRGISRESIKAKANNPILSKIKKVSRYSPISLYYKYCFKRLISKESLFASFHETSVSDMIDSIILVATSYKIGMHSSIILDEGLVHRIIAFGVNYNLSNTKIIQLITIFEDLLKNVDVVFVSVPIDEIMNFIRLRNRKETAMDYFDDTKLRDFITKYDVTCREVAEHFQFHRLCRQDVDNFIKENKRV